jgi:hypothetical protein
LVDLIQGIPGLEVKTQKYDFDGHHPLNLAKTYEGAVFGPISRNFPK